MATSLQQQLRLLELRTKWVPVTAENRIPAVTKGELDLECGTTTATGDRVRVSNNVIERSGR